MLKKSLIIFFLLGFVYSFSFENKILKKPVIKKKKASNSKIKEDIVDKHDLILQQSLELVRELTNLSDESLQCVREIVTNQDSFASKEECETCQKRLEQYNKKIRYAVRKN